MHKSSDISRHVQKFKTEEWQKGPCLGGLWSEGEKAEEMSVGSSH